MTITSDTFFFIPLAVDTTNVTVGPPDAEHQVFDPEGVYNVGDEAWLEGNAYRFDGTDWVLLGEVDGGAVLWTPGSYATGDLRVLNCRVWQSAKDSNTDTPGEAPLTSWTDIGPTNRFRAFDLVFNRPAVSRGEIKWTFDIPESINSLVVIVPRGAFCELIVLDADDVEVFNETVRITEDSGGGPYNHDFSPIDVKGRILFHGLEPGTGKTVSVRIYGTDASEVSVGQIAFGFAYDMGVTVVGTRVGVSNFVDPEENEFGIVDFSNRPVRRVASFNLKNINSQNERTLQRFADAIKQPVCVYLVDGEQLGLVMYGYATEIDLNMDNTALSSSFVEIKGFAER